MSHSRFEKPPAIYHYIVAWGFGIRKYLLRYLAFPRPSFMPAHFMTKDLSENGTYYYQKYDAAPYYVKPSLWERWKPGAWKSWMMGLPIPGDEGDKYFPGGYKIPEIGPLSMRGNGHGYIKAKVEELGKTRTGGRVFNTKAL